MSLNGKYFCIPKIPISPGKFGRNKELMQVVVNNAKGHDTEPGCQAYFFFQPADGNEEFLYGVEIYDTENDIKDTHFNSDAFQGFQAKGRAEGINPGPPALYFGYVKGGWLTRPSETSGTDYSGQPILFAKYTLHPGKRTAFDKVLLDGLVDIEKNEPGTLSIVLAEDGSNEDVTFVLERFQDQAALEAHMNGPGAAKVGPLVKEYVVDREGGLFKYVSGFIGKDS